MANANIKSLTRDFLTIRISTSDNSSQVKKADDSFEKQLDRTSKQNLDTDKKQTDTAKKSDLNSEIKKNQNVNRKQKELEEKAAVDAGENVVDNVSVAEDVTKELKESIAEELDISVEELEGLMNSMNFNDMDLFDSEKLGMIVLEANGLTQTQDLLFDKAAADEFKNVMALLDEAVTELEQSGIQVSEEEGFIDMTTGESIKPDNEYVAYDELKDAETDMSMEAEQDIPRDVLEADGDMKDVRVTDKAAEENKTDSPDEKLISDKNMQTDLEAQGNEGTKQDTGNDRRSQRDHNVRSEGGVISDANVRFNPIEEIQVELADRVGRSQAENIINQLAEQIRFNVNEEFKSMEMQLYPEHLGKVGVQVAVKDGILTAQITAENETVKKAIEAQLINLKESFNNQGLKVENVEVTIASHSFEENNMHNQDGQSNQGRGKKNRRLNSALVDELNGIADDQSEDAVMETLGNTVSYTA